MQSALKLPRISIIGIPIPRNLENIYFSLSTNKTKDEILRKRRSIRSQYEVLVTMSRIFFSHLKIGQRAHRRVHFKNSEDSKLKKNYVLKKIFIIMDYDLFVVVLCLCLYLYYDVRMHRCTSDESLASCDVYLQNRYEGLCRANVAILCLM